MNRLEPLEFYFMRQRERYFRDIDRQQWTDLLHSKGLHTRQELKQLRRHKIARVFIWIIISLVLLLCSCTRFDSNTICGMIVMGIFIAWCICFIVWCGYMNWKQRKGGNKKSGSPILAKPIINPIDVRDEPDNEFDPSSIF